MIVYVLAKNGCFAPNPPIAINRSTSMHVHHRKDNRFYSKTFQFRTLRHILLVNVIPFPSALSFSNHKSLKLTAGILNYYVIFKSFWNMLPSDCQILKIEEYIKNYKEDYRILLKDLPIFAVNMDRLI